MTTLVLAWILAACANGPEPLAPAAPPDPNVSRVLVLINENSSEAREIGAYYVQRRQIPKTQVLNLKLPTEYRFPEKDFETQIAVPVRAKLAELGGRIDFLVTTKGFPLAFTGEERRYSVDAFLAAMDLKWDAMPQQLTTDAVKRAANPYFGKNEPFTSKKFGFYLVTRLDGQSVEDCKKLVDNSLAAQPERGLFLLDGDPEKNNERFSRLPEALDRAASILKAKGLQVDHDTSGVFSGAARPLMGYVSWGSNDGAFDKTVYRSLRFLPGAIAETFVSTSARRMTAEEGGQSMIGDLVRAGITGVKGYVSEPYTLALARPDVLFDRYTSGRTLAESFYAASPVLKWKCVVIGDPICAPYAKR